MKKKIVSLLLCICMMLSMLPAAVSAAGATTLYLKPVSEWTADGARFAAYYWNSSSNAWADMSKSDADGIYQVEIPAGYTNVIFTRMNGSTTVNNWDNKWNQTADLTVPTDGTNMYVIELPWGNESNGWQTTGHWETHNPGVTCEHDWGTGSVTTPATCTAVGVKTYTCSKCSETKTESIPAAGHNMVDGKCTVCGLANKVIYFDNTANWSTVNVYFWSSANTTMTTWPGVAMTLVEGTIYSCSLPSDAENVIFNNGSAKTDDLTIPETDNLYTYSTGWSYYSTCDHVWDDGEVTTKPTCQDTGVKTFTCTACGETKTETVPVADHSYVNGTCTVCGDVLPCDHSWGDGVVTTNPTCALSGVRTYTCSKCGETKTETIDPLGHNFVDGKCTVCGAPEECTDHVWNDGEVITEKTCWTAGSIQYTCTVCGETKTETLYAGHDIYVASVTEPTCTKSGKQYLKCHGCAYSMDKTLPKIDHSYTVKGETVAATCTTDGYTVYTCSMCETATAQLDVVYHTGHSWSGNTCSTCGATCSHNYVDGICTGCSDGGPAYVEGWYEIANAAQLTWFANQVNSGNNEIDAKLVADIDLNGATWTSIGYYCKNGDSSNSLAYTGTFDGQGHTVSNFTTAGTDSEGLFGYCSVATIQNLGVINATVTGCNAGAVVGYASSTNVLNCFAKNCTITGYTTNAVALNSRQVHVGAVAGEGSGYVYNCYAVDCTLIDKTGDMTVPAGETYTPYHTFYAAPVGGNSSSISNNYYCNVTGTFSTTTGATEVTMAQLNSGEVTYNLNKGVVDGTQSWYQTCGVGMPAHSGKTVYKINDTTYANECTSHNFVDGICTICGAAGAHQHKYTAVVTPPTCTAGGYTTYTCDCGHSYTGDETPAADHNYVDGTCTACGGADPDYVVPVEKFDIAMTSMTMGNSLAMNIAFEQAEVSDWTGHYAVITKTYADGRENVVETVALADWKSANIGGVAHYYVTFNGIAAKEMTDDINVVIYNANDEAVSNVYTDSVAAQSARILAKDTTSDEEKTMIVDMLNYGAAAQTYFGYGTDKLANADLTEEQATYASEAKACTDIRVKGDNYVATNVVLKSNIQMMFAFQNIDTTMTAKVTFTNHRGVAKEVTVNGADFTKNGNFYVVTVDALVVADGRQAVTCVIYDANGNQVANATDSLESYTARKNGTEDIFVKMMQYSDSAYAYFH